MKRILMIYRGLAKGGTESIMFSRMAELAKRGIEVRSLFFLDYGGMVEALRDWIFVSQDEQAVRAYVQNFDPQWVLHLDTPELVKKIPGWLPAARQVYEVHTTYRNNYRPLKDRQMLKLIRGLITPSLHQAKVVRSIVRGSGVPVEVVPNGIEEQFAEEQKERVRTKGPVVVWVGRLESHKNWMMFLEIARWVSQRSPAAQFWMIGGSHATEQQQQILWYKMVQYGLIRRFRWFPDVPLSRMPILLQSAADSGGCIVSTSRGESFGLAVLEAMASGCPAVVPDVGGLRELVKPGVNGYIYRPNLVRDAGGYIYSLLSDPNLHRSLSNQAKMTALQYLPARMTDRLLAVLDLWTDSGIAA